MRLLSALTLSFALLALTGCIHQARAAEAPAEVIQVTQTKGAPIVPVVAAPAAPVVTTTAPDTLPAWVNPAIQILMFLIALGYAKLNTNQTKYINQGVSTAHWVIGQLKNAGVLKPGNFTALEDHFFQAFNDRYIADHGSQPNAAAIQAAYTVFTREGNALSEPQK